MDTGKNEEAEKNEQKDTGRSLIDKTEDWIDEAAEKLHQSEAYRKADKALESATKKLFRAAGRWWGKL